MDLHSFSECNASIRINSAKNHCAISFDGLSLVGGHGNCGHVAVRCAVHHPLRRFYEGAHVWHSPSLVLSWVKGFNGTIVWMLKGINVKYSANKDYPDAHRHLGPGGGRERRGWGRGGGGRAAAATAVRQEEEGLTKTGVDSWLPLYEFINPHLVILVFYQSVIGGKKAVPLLLQREPESEPEPEPATPPVKKGKQSASSSFADRMKAGGGKDKKGKGKWFAVHCSLFCCLFALF